MMCFHKVDGGRGDAVVDALKQRSYYSIVVGLLAAA